jgi:hypothetical protein
LTRTAFCIGLAFLMEGMGAAQIQGQPQRLSTRPMPELPVMLAYKLTPEKLTQYIQASRNVTALLARNPGYRDRMAIPPKTAPKTIDESVAFAKQTLPEIYSAVEKSGITFREYTIFQGCLLSAWVVALHPRPGSQVQILPENLQFVKTNHDAIAAALKEQQR